MRLARRQHGRTFGVEESAEVGEIAPIGVERVGRCAFLGRKHLEKGIHEGWSRGDHA